jgi:signal transduction histidine kinase
MIVETPHREWEEDALLGELARPLAHEFNNFLNTLVLQMAVMEHGRTPSADDLAAIRREAKAVAGLIRQWQRYIKQSAPAQAIDWNPIVREAAQSAGQQGASVEVSLAPQPARVCGSLVDLRRLCRLIVGNAVAATKQREFGKVRVLTEAADGKIALRVSDNREDVGADVSTWFDVRGARSSLEMAACQSLVRRLGGSIEALKKGANELTIQVLLPSAHESRDAD